MKSEALELFYLSEITWQYNGCVDHAENVGCVDHAENACYTYLNKNVWHI